MPLTKDHLHSYERSKTRSNIYKCTHPDCRHYTDAEFLEGKRALCATCGHQFLIVKFQLHKKRKFLRCFNCVNSKEAKLLRETLEGIFEELTPPKEANLFLKKIKDDI